MTPIFTDVPDTCALPASCTRVARAQSASVTSIWQEMPYLTMPPLRNINFPAHRHHFIAHKRRHGTERSGAGPSNHLSGNWGRAVLRVSSDPLPHVPVFQFDGGMCGLSASKR